MIVCGLTPNSSKTISGSESGQNFAWSCAHVVLSSAANFVQRFGLLPLCVRSADKYAIPARGRIETLTAGSPSQAGIEMDAKTALSHVCARSDVDATRIVVYGKSLGGAVALHMASRHEPQIRAVVVENSFLSVPEMVPRVFPFLGFAFGPNGFLNFLVRNKWRNREYVRQIKDTPLLLIASKKVSLQHLV